MPSASASRSPDLAASTPRWVEVTEWILTLGVAATLAWTTLCLGGALAETMVWASRATWAVAALGAVLLVVHPRPLYGRAMLPLPFLLFALASTLWLAPAKWLAWREWVGWFQMWLWFALGLHFSRSRAQAWTIFGTVISLAVVGAGMAAYQRFVDPTWMMLGRTQAEQFWHRSAGMFGVPNSLAGVLELVLPFLLVWFGSRSVSVTRKVLCAWLAALLLGALLLTGSRGGWLATALALALWPLLSGRGWKRGVLGGAGVLAALALGLTVAYKFLPAAQTRIEPFLRGEFEASRPLLWRAGWELWQRAPVLGTGAASYNILFDQVRPLGYRQEPHWTHNDYLNTLSDYGAVGFALWAGAGVTLLWLAWRRVHELRRANTAGLPALDSARGRFGLWLGLGAYCVHLSVDFHTKIPALAWMFAWMLALALRDTRSRAAGLAWRAIVAAALIASVAAAAWKSDAALRAEAGRADARRKIDRIALGKESLPDVVPWALLDLQKAVGLDPANAQAWGDYSYAVALSWHVTRVNARATGQRAEEAARRALALCPDIAEFWVHLGVALDMQGGTADAEQAFRRALALAPHTAEWHYYYAYHLAAIPERRDDALRSTQTCLDLDPTNPQAEALLARLKASR